MTGFKTLGEKRTHDTLAKARLRAVPERVTLLRQHSPLGVAVVLDIVLALAEGVPELDCPVARARDNLTVVRREADGEYIGSVPNEAAGGVAGVKIP